MEKLALKRSRIQKEQRAQLPVVLRTLRVNAGLKQETVAEFLQISRSTYSYYEMGKTVPNIFTLHLLCRFYGIPMEAFFMPEFVKNLYPNLKRVREHFTAVLKTE